MDNIIRNSLSYCPVCGVICWKVGSNIGSEAGSLVKTQTEGLMYRCIRINGKKFLSHRVAWFLFFGSWPEDFIDHVNGNGLDNSIKNLRDVSQAFNMRNITRKTKTKRKRYPVVMPRKPKGAVHATRKALKEAILNGERIDYAHLAYKYSSGKSTVSAVIKELAHEGRLVKVDKKWTLT